MYFLAAASSSLISLYLAFVRNFETAIPYSLRSFLLVPMWHTLHFAVPTASTNLALPLPSTYLPVHSLLNGGRAVAMLAVQLIASRQSTIETQTFFILKTSKLWIE